MFSSLKILPVSVLRSSLRMPLSSSPSFAFCKTLTPKDILSTSDKTLTPKDILSTNEIHIYKKLFDKMDSNSDGLLTKEDLRKGLKDYVDYTATEDELKETMDVLDGDKDGSVGFDEFIGYIAWSRKMRTDEAIKHAFEMFDKNNDGLISKDEVREALVSLGVIPNESLLNNIMLLNDKDSDDNLTLDEFRRIFYRTDITK